MKTVYVCCEINCPHLCSEVDTITDLCVFDTPERAVKWQNDRIKEGEKNGFIVDEGDNWKTDNDTLEELDKRGMSATTMFLNHQDNWDSNYDICIIKKEVNNNVF